MVPVQLVFLFQELSTSFFAKENLIDFSRNVNIIKL